MAAVATRDSGKTWKRKHLPFDLTGIHIRRSSASPPPSPPPPQTCIDGSCALGFTAQTKARVRMLSSAGNKSRFIIVAI